jgi:FAD/FMN-containing dehydrogenase
MNQSQQLTAFALQDVAGDSLIQESPYPVIAPRTTESLSLIVQYARIEDRKLLVLGPGSSFAEDFNLSSKQVIAVMMYRLSGVEQTSSFAMRILSGTPVDRVCYGMKSAARRTIGGAIGDSVPGQNDVAGAIYGRLLTVEVIDANGKLLRLSGPGHVHRGDPGLAHSMFGSRGRLGIITAVEVAGSLPLVLADLNPDNPRVPSIAAHESPVRRPDISRVLDSDGLFAW